MLKKDVITYLAVNDNIRNKGNKILTEILGCSNALVSRWRDDDLIPAYRAMELAVFFSKKPNRVKYGLSDDHPAFSLHNYIGEDGKVTVTGRANSRPANKLEHDYRVRTSNAAIRILARADKAKTNESKLAILTRFIKGLI